MIPYPAINPVALSLGPLQIHWYGIMYLLAFAGAYMLAARNSQRPWAPIKRSQVEDLITYGAWGVILGGRLGYLFFFTAPISGSLIQPCYFVSGRAACHFMAA